MGQTVQRIITPNQCKIGIMPGDIHMEGSVGIVSRSGINVRSSYRTSSNNLGQSTCIGIGGDPINGTSCIDC